MLRLSCDRRNDAEVPPEKADGPEAKRIQPPKLWSRRHEKPVVPADLNVPTIFNRKRW